MGDRRDCRTAATEGPLYEAGTPHHCRRATSEEPLARIPETAFPEPYVLTETEDKIIDYILALLNKHGLTLQQSQNLLERLGRIIGMGQRVAKGTTH